MRSPVLLRDVGEFLSDIAGTIAEAFSSSRTICKTITPDAEVFLFEPIVRSTDHHPDHRYDRWQLDGCSGDPLTVTESPLSLAVVNGTVDRGRAECVPKRRQGSRTAAPNEKLGLGRGPAGAAGTTTAIPTVRATEHRILEHEGLQWRNEGHHPRNQRRRHHRPGHGQHHHPCGGLRLSPATTRS